MLVRTHTTGVWVSGGGGGSVVDIQKNSCNGKANPSKTEDIAKMMGQRWASVVDGGLSLVYAWDNISCLPGWDAELWDTGQQVAVGRAAP